MSQELIDVRTPLAASDHVRLELGDDDVLHLLVGPVTLHLDRGRCVELTTTLARGMVRLSQLESRPNGPQLELVR